MVRERGLEPLSLAAVDFEPTASTSSATLAYLMGSVRETREALNNPSFLKEPEGILKKEILPP